MYLTQTNYIRHLSKVQYEAILEMCVYAVGGCWQAL